MIIKDIHKFRNYFLNVFIRNFEKNSFLYHQSLPLKIDFDSTLNFTNSSICIYKYYYLTQQKCKDYVTVQEAIRTNTYNILLNDDLILSWNSHLTMLGGFINANSQSIEKKLKESIYNIYEYLSMIIEKKIILTIPPEIKIEFDDQFLRKKNLKIIYLKNSLEELKWKFGINGIDGIGIRWEIEGPQILNCGNNIIMYKNGIPIGIDFGLGLEVLVQSKLELPHKIFASIFYTIFENIGFELDNKIIKIIDALATYITLLDETKNLKIASRSIARTATYYLKAIIHLKNKIDNKIFLLILDLLIKNNPKWNINSILIKNIILENIEKKMK